MLFHMEFGIQHVKIAWENANIAANAAHIEHPFIRNYFNRFSPILRFDFPFYSDFFFSLIVCCC